MGDSKMTEKELFDKIRDWEIDAGESFWDYFAHDNIRDNSWAFWLLGKGYTNKANEIIGLILKGDKCIDQEVLYDVFPSSDPDGSNWNEEKYNKNIMIMCEFLLATDYYKTKVLEWFNEN